MKGKFNCALVCALAFSSSVLLQGKLAAQSLPTRSGANPSATASSQAPAESLKAEISAQQKEINQLRAMLQKQQELLRRLLPASSAAATKRASSEVRAAIPNHPSSTGVKALEPKATMTKTAEKLNALPKPPVDSPKQAAEPEAASAAPLAPITVEPPLPVVPGQQRNPALTNSPITPIPLKIGRATITPVGFVDATEFFRSENLGSGIGTSFGGVPFSNSVQGHISENRLSIQNSRIGAELDSTFHGWPVRAYWESDFLGYQPNGAFVTSNSDSFRLRLFWARVRFGKIDFMAGQSWSLLTPGRTGISPMPSNIFYSEDMDTNYQVGLPWSRQLQFRLTYHASPIVTAAFSVEDSDPFVGGAVIPSAYASEVDNGTNNGAPAFVPDFIGKLAFDPKVHGRDMHFEFAGLLSNFRTVNPATNAKNTATGGGGSFNLNFELWKNFHLIANTYYSSGGGRYIIGLAPDFIVRPDGTISLVQADSGIGGFEYQINPKTMLYSYYSTAYFGRDYAVVPSATPGGAPTFYGWGYPGSSSSQNRTVQEPTFGWIQTFWKNPHYGALQLITQYSYLIRAPWYVAPGSPRNAHLNLVYADIRYVLP